MSAARNKPALLLSLLWPLAGNGQLVRALRARNRAAWGIELSQAVLERDAADLLAAGLVEQGSLTDLPYAGQYTLPQELATSALLVLYRLM